MPREYESLSGFSCSNDNKRTTLVHSAAQFGTGPGLKRYTLSIDERGQTAMKQQFRFGAIAMLAALAVAAPGHAQTTSPDGATMRELLTEVRQLRLALEKSILLGPKMQLMMQRAQLQDQRVARISQQLDNVRKQIADETARRTKVTEAIAEIDQELSGAVDAEQRKQLETTRANLKNAAAAGPDQQLAARESEFARSLEAEQAVLNELNEKMDAMVRQLEVPQPAQK